MCRVTYQQQDEMSKATEYTKQLKDVSSVIEKLQDEYDEKVWRAKAAANGRLLRQDGVCG